MITKENPFLGKLFMCGKVLGFNRFNIFFVVLKTFVIILMVQAELKAL